MNRTRNPDMPLALASVTRFQPYFFENNRYDFQK